MIFVKPIIGVLGVWNDTLSRNEGVTKEEEDGRGRHLRLGRGTV